MIKTGHDLPIEEVAHRYQMLTDQRGMLEEFYERILDLVGPLSGLRVLDVGCGDGILLKKIAHHFPTAELFGADIVPSSSNLEKNRIRLVTADLRHDLPFQSKCMDLVICSETLEHLVDPDRQLKEMTRVLRTGGRLVVTIPNATGYFPFHYLGWWIPTRTLRRKFLPYEHPANTKQPVDTMYEFHEIVELVESNDLKIQRLVGYRYFRYLLGLRLIGSLYRTLTPLVERAMELVGGQRFAYNLIVFLVPCNSASPRSDGVIQNFIHHCHERLKTKDAPGSCFWEVSG